MQKEQFVKRKKILQSDWLLLMIMVVGMFLASLFLRYLEQAFSTNTQVLQIILFALILIAAYLILKRQLGGYRYVLTEKDFFVYQVTGKSQSLKEHVRLTDAVFLCPYSQATGQHGRENALCEGDKRHGVVLAHQQSGKRLQWLIISPDSEMFSTLSGNIAAVWDHTTKPAG